MNKLTIIGRLTADPKRAATKAGKELAQFTVAVDRGRGEHKTTDFFRVTAWEKRGDTICQYFHKGDKICVVGYVTASAYMVEGEARASLDVTMEEFEFCETRRQHEEKPKEEFVQVQEDLPW